MTGAPNITIGMTGVKVPLALSGARLVDAYAPEGGFTVLKPSKIRGVRSEGMVCSEKELGISTEHGGILLLPEDAEPGTPLVDYLGDTVLHVELTPNLSHCLSLAGIAREVAAMGCGTLVERAESFAEGDGAAAEMVAVRIEAPELCGRYCAAVVERGDDRPRAVRDAPPAASGRHPADQQRRRRDQLRDVGDRPAAARVRPRHAARRGRRRRRRSSSCARRARARP